jgi:hypothetical protein
MILPWLISTSTLEPFPAPVEKNRRRNRPCT